MHKKLKNIKARTVFEPTNMYIIEIERRWMNKELICICDLSIGERVMLSYCTLDIYKPIRLIYWICLKCPKSVTLTFIIYNSAL